MPRFRLTSRFQVLGNFEFRVNFEFFEFFRVSSIEYEPGVSVLILNSIPSKFVCVCASDNQVDEEKSSMFFPLSQYHLVF